MTNKELAEKIALEGMVLLKNDGALPLTNKKIALFGSGARFTTKGGTGSGDVNVFHSISIEEGLINLGCEILSTYYLDECEERLKVAIKERNRNIKKAAKGIPMSDWASLMEAVAKYPPIYNINRLLTDDDKKIANTEVGVYVVSRQAGEGGDRLLKEGDYYLTNEEKQGIDFVCKNYDKSIVVLNTSAPIDVKDILLASPKAIVLYGQAGQEGGIALSKLLYGMENFSGKLTVSWPENIIDLDISKDYSYLDKDTENEIYRDDIYVGYRYYNSFNKKAIFPFGFGLSYSSFSTEAEAKQIEDEIIINVKVKNIGNYIGKEIVQAYIRPIGFPNKEFQSLFAFTKTNNIKPNETESITLRGKISDLATYIEEKHKFVLLKGIYALYIGNSSENVSLLCNLKINEDYEYEQGTTLVKKPLSIDTLKAECHEMERKSKCIIIDTSLIKKESVSEEKLNLIENNIKDLDLCKMVVGVMPFKTKGAAGVVGELSPIYSKYGFNNIYMSDGPSGLRLAKEFYKYRNGINKPTTFIPYDLLTANSFYRMYEKFVTFSFMKKKQQYTTAFPVPLVQAQSFNLDLLYELGEAIQKEMNDFNIDIWLAPGMNIIRHPLCGRAFEYYSEDPLLTGKLAASVSKGVSSNGSKKTVCLKHFCCNNQEENRMKTNSVVSERALQEIYLKGFKIAIKESHPKAIMTSYNKVNGEYVNSNIDFIDGFLRKECGHKGIVMTDWSSVGPGQAEGYKVINAGNDLIMYGNKKIYNPLFEKLKTNELNKEQLNRCVNRLIEFLNR